jgi:hypothetical protein
MELINEGMGELIVPPDLEEFRAWNREKPKAMFDKRMDESEAIDRFVTDGCYLETELYGTVRGPMSLTHEIIRQGKYVYTTQPESVLDEMVSWPLASFQEAEGTTIILSGEQAQELGWERCFPSRLIRLSIHSDL